MTTDALFWDNIAERYARKPLSNPDSYAQKVAITKARLRDGDAVLDIGCGTGSLAIELSPHVAEVHALDISGGMIAIGRRKAELQQATNITFHQTTLGETSFGPERFDTICAYNILHLVDDRQATLSQIFDYLKPGGTFVSSTPCLGDSWIPFGAVISVMRWFGKAPWVDIVKSSELLGDMGTAGFTNVQTPDVNANKGVAFVVATKPSSV